MRRILVLSALGVVIALLVMAVSPLYAVFLIALLAQGAAAGAFRGIDRAVLSHLHSARRGRIYAAYALVWAVGAVLGPQLVSGVLVVADWRAVFVVIALCFLPTILIASRTELPSMDAERSLSRSALRELLQRRSVIGACVGIMLVGAIEGILFTWLVYYASSFYEPTTANLLLSVYLLAYMPARLGYTFLIDRVPSLLLVLATAIPTIPALAVAFSGQTRRLRGRNRGRRSRRHPVGTPRRCTRGCGRTRSHHRRPRQRRRYGNRGEPAHGPHVQQGAARVSGTRRH